ncbi:MAG: phosphoribosylformylglycinamidine synthase subunit PurL [Thermoplasmata archaeon]
METEFLEAVEILNSGFKELDKISKNYNLGLSTEEMLRIKSYFSSQGRNPTDVELQAIGQAWSEHCGYKSSKVYLKKFIFGIAPNKILSQGDAGLVDFNDDIAIALKMESHNHPSAIEPYGGAATGVGGILRDVLSMGGQPIAVTDVLYFGERSRKGFPSPKFIESGVISGIRDYGNRVGIPTVSGGIFYSNDFVPNVLVNVGCVGIVKKNNIMKASVDKPGLKLIIAGGKTGRDGIHGVNMASKTLEKGEEDTTTVQLGNPIIKEPLIHAVLEANERKLIYALKDLGGGGLSSVIGEMLLSGGMGGDIHLEKVPLKESNMKPWEIWISESQERMMLAVKEENVNEVMDIFNSWDITAAIIGHSRLGKDLRIYYNGQKVLDMDLEFLTSSPLYYRSYRHIKQPKESFLPSYPKDIERIMLKMIGNINVRTREYAVRQYDHTVRGSTVIGPFSGNVGSEGPTDASIIRPSWDRSEGIAISHGSNPFYSKIDPFRGAKAAVDEAVRNIVSSGAKPIAFSDCLNAGNPEIPEIMGEFISMLSGLRDSASSLEIPYVSGNVSFYNQTGKSRIPTLPTILAVGKIDRIEKALTPDFKNLGNPVYMIGLPYVEMGGSLYSRILKFNDNNVPNSDPTILKSRITKFSKAFDDDLILSSHDISDGGLAVALAEMTIGSGIGVDVDISSFGMRSDMFLFSESQSRFVIEGRKGSEERIREIFGNDAFIIGYTSESFKGINGEESLFNIELERIRKKWKEGYI